ncbi:MAG: hypothetical protein IPM54_26360 [Polyangiaceae bacterium]|nr:hypothetical protein [Polyangiaceae bacterium]
MRKRLWAGMALLGGFTITVGVGCETNVDGGSSGGSGGSAGSAGNAGSAGSGGGALQWYTTCGDPVCMEPPDGGAMPPAGVMPCTTEMVGASCTTAGATCWPSNSSCGELLICATSDPKESPGGCPISRVSYKKNVEYLSDAEIASIADEAKTMRLSSWHYKGEGEASRRHVGFLIDDMPESIAVAESGERVDLYGYTSMAIAAVQVQDKRLETLERELLAMRAEMVRLRAEAARCNATPKVE